MDERARRLGANEAVFREVNERIEAMNATFASPDATIAIVCECGFADCAAQFVVAVSEYEHVRAEPRWFLVLAGHEIPDIERIVERHEEFNVIEKLAGGPGELAEATDPRG